MEHGHKQLVSFLPKRPRTCRSTRACTFYDSQMYSMHTVLPGAEERGVQHHSLVSFLILLIPADLRSYLRSPAVMKAVQCTSFAPRMQNTCTTMSFQNQFFSSFFFVRQIYDYVVVDTRMMVGSRARSYSYW